jgi:hypothetical protein
LQKFPPSELINAGAADVEVHRTRNAASLSAPAEGVQNHPFADTGVSIVVEINPPVAGIDRNASGVFLRDDHGNVILAHRGRIGGGDRRTSATASISAQIASTSSAGRTSGTSR